MKVLFEWADMKLIMDAAKAEEIINLINRSAEEVYEHKRNWSSKEESHHVYPVSAQDLGVQSIRILTDDLYALGKLRGKPED